MKLNRIIIIGNGFDLAHGFKTSYNDFIDWILSEKYKLFVESKYRLEDIDFKYFNRSSPPGEELFKKTIKEASFKNIYNTQHEVIDFYNDFMKEIFKSQYINGWADIEALYYEKLNDVLLDVKKAKKNTEKLNHDFMRITSLLQQYLSKVIKNNEEIDTLTKVRISEIISSKIQESHLSINYLKSTSKGSLMASGISPSNTLILDFNYTQVIKKHEITRFKYINIHGVLNSVSNPIIFGFGDELDENYAILEKSKIEGCLKNIKSINYLKTKNYRETLNFIEDGFFQVLILGHSCGLTDRTLLNHIFEHNNCAGIRPYYYEKNEYNNYEEIISNITRNFKDKNKLRDRVVNYTFCEALMPS